MEEQLVVVLCGICLRRRLRTAREREREGERVAKPPGPPPSGPAPRPGRCFSQSKRRRRQFGRREKRNEGIEKNGRCKGKKTNKRQTDRWRCRFKRRLSIDQSERSESADRPVVAFPSTQQQQQPRETIAAADQSKLWERAENPHSVNGEPSGPI